MPNIAKSKLFILQRKHSTENHNRRTAGTNIYKALCPALTVPHVFSLVNSAEGGLAEPLHRVPGWPPCPARPGTPDAALAGSLWVPRAHSLEQWRNSKRRWEPRKRSMGMGSLTISPQRGLLLWYSTKEWYALRLGSPEPRLMQSCHKETATISTALQHPGVIHSACHDLHIIYVIILYCIYIYIIYITFI